MSPARAQQDHPARRAEIEDALTNQFHVDWQFFSAINLDDFDFDKSLANQARIIESPIDEDTVERYREAAERGDTFPGVVAYRPGRARQPKLVIIDGNHRLVAYQRAGRETIPVYEVDRATKAQTIALMTFAINTKHGRPIAPKDAVHHAVYLVNNGASIPRAAADMNVEVAKVQAAVARQKAEERAKTVGIDMRVWEALNAGARKRLLGVSTDEGFVKLTQLAVAAGLGSDEISEEVAMLNSSGKSAKTHLKILAEEEKRFRPRIQATAGGAMPSATQRRGVTPKARLAMVLGQVFTLPEDVSVIANTYAEAERADEGKRIWEAAEQLRAYAIALDPSLA